jgi:hypothetical protein
MKMTANEKVFELQSCRPCRDLQLSYKAFIHPSSYEIVIIFLKKGKGS